MTIVFDNCLMIREIRIVKSTTGLFVSFPARKQRDGAHWDIVYPANAEARNMIQRVDTGGVREGDFGKRLCAECQRKIIYNAKRDPRLSTTPGLLLGQKRASILRCMIHPRVVFTEDGIGCCALDSRARRSSHCVEFRYKLWLIR